jgi:uncharacterized protein YeeX (DUF496 family)
MDQEMNLRMFLLMREREILQKWYNRMEEVYPPEMRSFWENKESRFTQPIPYTITQAMQTFYQEVLKFQPDEEKVYSELEAMMRICAVQNLQPSKAVRTLYQLKEVIREELRAEDIRSVTLLQELLDMENQLDQWMLRAFDFYMEFREKIYELRMKEVRNQMGF